MGEGWTEVTPRHGGEHQAGGGEQGAQTESKSRAVSRPEAHREDIEEDMEENTRQEEGTKRAQTGGQFHSFK